MKRSEGIEGGSYGQFEYPSPTKNINYEEKSFTPVPVAAKIDGITVVKASQTPLLGGNPIDKQY